LPSRGVCTRSSWLKSWFSRPSIVRLGVRGRHVAVVEPVLVVLLVVRGDRGHRPAVREPVVQRQAGPQRLAVDAVVAERLDLVDVVRELVGTLDLAAEVAARAVGRQRKTGAGLRADDPRQVAVQLLRRVLHQERGVALVAVLGVQHLRDRLEVLGGRPAQLRADVGALLRVDVALAVVLVDEVPAEPVDAAVELAGQHVRDQRQHDVAAALVVVVLTGRDVDATGEFVARLARDEVDRTRERAAPEQRRLRPLDDLDAFEIVELVARDVAGDEDAVDEEAGVGAAEDVRHAADRRPHGGARVAAAGASEALPEREAGGLVGEIRDALDAGLLDRGLRERGDRDRHVDEVFLALARGHDDLAECGFALQRRIGRAACRLCPRGRRYTGARGGHRGHQDCSLHEPPPKCPFLPARVSMAPLRGRVGRRVRRVHAGSPQCGHA
jgi:hypothetical protein